MLLAAGIVAGLTGAPQAGAAGWVQTEKGTIAVPTPHPQQTDVCFQGIARRAYVYSQGGVSGPVGGVFRVKRHTWGGRFKLTADKGTTGREDLDIYFFSDLDDIENDPTLQTPLETSHYSRRRPGGETGIIPQISNYAIVCLHAGTATDWTYKGIPRKR